MTLARKPLAKISKKPRRCDWCRIDFVRVRLNQKCCSIKCSIEWAKNEQVKRACAPYRSKPKKTVKDKSHQTQLTQRKFNEWCRLRDKGLPCISCGITYGKMEAGHYRSRGAAPELRFEPLNVHSQCSQCNNSKSGNIGPYRIGLIRKIGIEKVEWLEGPHEPKKYTIEDLQELRKHYSRLIREAG